MDAIDNIAPEEGQEQAALPKLVPQIVKQAVQHMELKDGYRPGFEPYAGEYHLIELDADGNEKAGTDFSIPEAMYYKCYQPFIGKTFAIKKKPANK
jgi:hypothetical protein